MVRKSDLLALLVLSIGSSFVISSFFSYLVWRKTKKNPAIERYDIDGRFTNICTYGNLVFMSGQIGVGSTLEEQFKSALEEVDLALKKAGSNKSDILEFTIWLKDMNRDYDKMNIIYDSWIDKMNPPCRACIQATLYSPDCLVEVRAIAKKS